jgi:EcsC protein family
VIGLGNTRSAGTGRTARAAVVLSGAVGGFYGMAGFVPDAAFTTLAILREIGRVAQEQGEELTGDEGRRACLDVFLLSPRATLGEPEGESRASYLASRLVMQGRPMVALLEQAAARYGLALSEKFAAQAVPVVGALCGAAVNDAFLAHYREVARAYFTVRRLMRMHGKEQVMAELAGIYAENRRDPHVPGTFH